MCPKCGEFKLNPYSSGEEKKQKSKSRRPTKVRGIPAFIHSAVVLKRSVNMSSHSRLYLCVESVKIILLLDCANVRRERKRPTKKMENESSVKI